MRLGYNTNGLAGHGWRDSLELLAETGYESVAITVDHHWLNPYSERFAEELRDVRRMLRDLNLNCVIETGARFLLDPGRKHFPTLISTSAAARAKRIEFLARCLEIAGELNADALSFWSGTGEPGLAAAQAADYLRAGIEQLLPLAEASAVPLAFEPEPGMLIETLAQWQPFQQELDSPWLGVTIDIGHLHCNGETPIADHLAAWHPRLFNIHIEDMRAGVHEHLRFGEGEIDFPPIIACLDEIDYRYGVHVELSRHSHMAPTVVRESWDFLNRLRARAGAAE